MDYLEVVLVGTGWLGKRALQDEHYHGAEGSDTPLTFWFFIDYFTRPSFDSSVQRIFHPPAIFTTSSLSRLASILEPASLVTAAALVQSPTLSFRKLHRKSPFRPA
jgi:hypothetical protein